MLEDDNFLAHFCTMAMMMNDDDDEE